MSGEKQVTTIYVFCNSCEPNWHSIASVTADGRGVAGHVCSHHGFVEHDMGFVGDWKHDTYNEMFPDGWALEWVEDPRNHPVIKALIEACRAKKKEVA